MPNSKSYLDIAMASLRVFANDGKLDAAEFDQLIRLALRDHDVDADERAILAIIFRRAEKSPLPPELVARIAEARAKHGIPA